MPNCLDLDSASVMQAGPLEPYCVEPMTPVRDVLEQLKAHRRAAALVCQDGVLVGIFTERDALRLLARDEALDQPIQGRMISEVVTLSEDDTLSTAVVRMASNGYRRLPVVDGAKRPIGVVEVAGIVHWLVEHFPEAVYNLPPVTNPATQSREGP